MEDLDMWQISAKFAPWLPTDKQQQKHVFARMKSEMTKISS
jgi:hypothetical protein